jgi:uncharacterized protein (DUF305 family)
MRVWLLVPLLMLGLAGGTAVGQERRQTVPLYSDGDLMFLMHMIVHHQQAIDMAALVPARSDRDELLEFARHIAAAQQTEIDHMKTLLQAAADRGQRAPEHEMSGDPPMRGMLSKAQMTALAASTGLEFEKLWLEGMIQHHQGAIDMALAQQQHEFETRRQPYGIAAMADDILATQRGEIGMMKTWRAAWGHEAPTAAR